MPVLGRQAHPGAQLSFSDHDGHRFQAILTDQPEHDIAHVERRHRARARVEDHIRNDKDTGLRNLPFRDFEHNQVWLQLVLIAHDLLAWTQRLLLTGELARSEPKRLRHRPLHVAARLAFHARTAKLRLQANWPWATDLAAQARRLVPNAANCRYSVTQRTMVFRVSGTRSSSMRPAWTAAGGGLHFAFALIAAVFAFGWFVFSREAPRVAGNL